MLRLIFWGCFHRNEHEDKDLRFISTNQKYEKIIITLEKKLAKEKRWLENRLKTSKECCKLN